MLDKIRKLIRDTLRQAPKAESLHCLLCDGTVEAPITAEKLWLHRYYACVRTMN